MKPMKQPEKTKYLELIASIVKNPKLKTHSNTEIQILARELVEWCAKKLWDAPSVQIHLSDGKNYQDLPNVDFDKVRNAWLGWHNDLRASQGLEPYTYHSDLEKSAKTWADYLASIKQWTHKRSANDGYYNYQAIKSWFAGLDIIFPSETGGRSAFSESIGYRSYRCSSNDCTQALIDATKKTFNGFVAEGKNGPHYKALVMPHFKQMGIGFQFEPEKKYIYTVIHYAGDILE